VSRLVGSEMCIRDRMEIEMLQLSVLEESGLLGSRHLVQLEQCGLETHKSLSRKSRLTSLGLLEMSTSILFLSAFISVHQR
jgi:hypothetical protein